MTGYYSLTHNGSRENPRAAKIAKGKPLMFEWDIENRHFYIRDVENEPELHLIEAIQKQAWGFSDLDIVPAATLIATQHAGGIVLGAFEGDHMIGFAYAFPAFENGHTSMHSHMLAVLSEYRNFQAGFYLKVAQREQVLANGLDEVTWTFDPASDLERASEFFKAWCSIPTIPRKLLRGSDLEPTSYRFRYRPPVGELAPEQRKG
jgi:hypothetical protein